MSVDTTTEKQFESDIEAFFLSPQGGYTHNNDLYDPLLGIYVDTLINFVQKTQPNEWKRFCLQNAVDPAKKFCQAFNMACDMDVWYQCLDMDLSIEVLHFEYVILNRSHH